jgi:hypothetical protein
MPYVAMRAGIGALARMRRRNGNGPMAAATGPFDDTLSRLSGP